MVLGHEGSNYLLKAKSERSNKFMYVTPPPCGGKASILVSHPLPACLASLAIIA